MYCIQNTNKRSPTDLALLINYLLVRVLYYFGRFKIKGIHIRNTEALIQTSRVSLGTDWCIKLGYSLWSIVEWSTSELETYYEFSSKSLFLQFLTKQPREPFLEVSISVDEYSLGPIHWKPNRFVAGNLQVRHIQGLFKSFQAHLNQ